MRNLLLFLQKGDQTEEEMKRPRWSSQTMFFWAATAAPVGMSNYLIFCSLSAKHGGVKIFLIPYLICLLFLNMPLMTLQLGLGQKN